jgi:hypothetical protein
MDLSKVKVAIGSTYDSQVLFESENCLKLEIYCFYRLIPFEVDIFNSGMVYIETTKQEYRTIIEFSLLNAHFILHFLLSLLVCFTALYNIAPESYVEIIGFGAFFFLIFFSPAILIGWYKHNNFVRRLKDY